MRSVMMRGTAVLALLAAACGEGQQTARTDAIGGAGNAEGDPQVAFWHNLLALCDQAYEGRLIEAPAGDTSFAGQRLVMHVSVCSDEEIRIPFHVGENRSRTWVISPTDFGMRLKHDHRHEDGSPDEITMYGGDTRDPGTPEMQEFYADEHTSELIPAAATNVWTVEVYPGEQFVYALRREGTDRRFRIEFDLRREVPAPPAPW